MGKLPLDDDDDELLSTGISYPEYLLFDSWYAFRNFGILPYAGGLFDQPPEWWAEIKMLEAFYTHAYETHRESDANADNDLFKDM